MRIIEHKYAPANTVYFLEDSYIRQWCLQDLGNPIMADLYNASFPDPLIHSLRWHRAQRPVKHEWVEDGL